MTQHTATADQISAALTRLVQRSPFLAALACRWRVEIDDTGRITKTSATDSKTLWVHPPWFEGLERDHRLTVMGHEALHVALEHHLRREDRHPKLWNIAADFAINAELVTAGFKMPPEGCYDPKYNGMTAEQIYKLLEQEAKQQGGRGKPEPGDPLDGLDAGPGMGDILDAPGMDTPEGKAQAESETRAALAEALSAAKQAGEHVPDCIQRQITAKQIGDIDWRAALADWLGERRDKTDYTWMRPSRRGMSQGAYLPSMESEQRVGTIAVMVDTSGSMGPDELAAALGDIQRVCDSIAPGRMIVAGYDTELRTVTEIDPQAPPPSMELGGGGGTSFDTWHQELAAHPSMAGVPIDGAIFVTDGYVSSWGTQPAFPVLWVLPSHGSPRGPYGRSVWRQS